MPNYNSSPKTEEHEYATTIVSKEPAYDRINALARMKYLNNTERETESNYSPLEFLEYSEQGNPILLKDEASFSKVRSFKNRGAWNALVLYYSNPKNHRLRTVIAPSAGNHAQGVLDSVATFRDKGYTLHVPPAVHLYIPKTTAPSKVIALKEKAASSGLTVEIFDSANNFDEAEQQAIYAANNSKSSLLIHPFDNPDVIEGQGTSALEIIEQLQTKDVDLSKVRIFIPVGGGGLASGFVRANEKLPENQKMKLVGVQLERADSAYKTWRNYQDCKEVVTDPIDSLNYLADGTMVKALGEHTAPYVVQLDDFVVVSNSQVGAQYFKTITSIDWQPGQTIAEPASMIGQTGCYTYKKQGTNGEIWVAVNTGNHANPDYVEEFVRQYQATANTANGVGSLVLQLTN